jgi:hypothetical protein
MKRIRYRYIGLLVLAGFAVLIFGFIYNVIFAGIPYQDPTPQLIANYVKHTNIASIIYVLGFILVIAGAVLLALKKLTKHKSIV